MVGSEETDEMAIPNSGRFWATTRGRIILLLRGKSRTVNELAEALSLTDNAVRTHLTALERDSLVQVSGSRPGTRKPSTIYELTEDARKLFPKAYGPVLSEVLDGLGEYLSPKKIDALIRGVGLRLSRQHRAAFQADALADRAAAAVALLREWGGMTELQQQDGHLSIHSTDCPLAAVVESHPEICRVVETMLTELLGVPVRQRCQHSPRAQCHFEIGAAAS